MKYWRFMDYYTEDGINLISEWYFGQEATVRAAFDTTIDELSKTRSVEQWESAEQGKRLKGRHAGLCEVKFKIGKRKFRPVGFISIFPVEDELNNTFSAGEFVLILGCEKSGRIYIPNNAFDTALELQALYLEQSKGNIHEHDI